MYKSIKSGYLEGLVAKVKVLTSITMLLIFIIAVMLVSNIMYTNTYKNKIQSMEQELSSMVDESKRVETYISELKLLLKQYQDVDTKNKKLFDSLLGRTKVDRGTTIRGDRFRVTAYSLAYKDCEKYPSHPEYGITASGEKVKEWYTIAAGPDIPFGTKIYIPYFKDYPNEGMFVVKDRGGAIRKGCLDVYMSSTKESDRFGLQYLDAYIIGNSSS